MADALQNLLNKLKKAKSVDEGDEVMDEMARFARKYPEKMIDRYFSDVKNRATLVWAMQRIKGKTVLDVLKHAMQSKDWNVRWSAAERLKHFKGSDIRSIFMKASKDRADLVKIVAKEWLKKNEVVRLNSGKF